MFTDPQAEKYSIAHTTEESTVLKKLNRETHAKILKARMLSGHMQGKLLEMISCMLQPSVVLEIGTYTGYSAICLSKGLAKGGTIHTIDHNEELEDFSRSFFRDAGIEDSIEYHIGEALEVLPSINGPFDLVFLDADKENYIAYYDEVIDKVRRGGVILADNVLWSGKVFSEEAAGNDPEAHALIQFNGYVHNDPRVENLMLPFRDGLSIIRKIVD
ncbi:MAG: O-methyltransferase [Bacteroidetes bacterium]|nr:MAG: O-methyltransferase [Bacteroidota bacterium]